MTNLTKERKRQMGEGIAAFCLNALGPELFQRWRKLGNPSSSLLREVNRLKHEYAFDSQHLYANEQALIDDTWEPAPEPPGLFDRLLETAKARTKRGDAALYLITALLLDREKQARKKT